MTSVIKFVMVSGNCEILFHIYLFFSIYIHTQKGHNPVVHGECMIINVMAHVGDVMLV